MSLRWKIAVAMAAVVAVTALVFGAASYRSTKARLFDEVDQSLLNIERAIAERRIGVDAVPDRGPLQGFDVQIIGPTGVVRQSTFETPLPVTDDDRALIGQRLSRFTTVSTGDGDYRVRTVGVNRGAVQIGRSLDETDRVLASLRARTLLLGALVAGLAALLGLWIAGRVTASLRRLTLAAEHVGATGALDIDVVAGGGVDEVGRLSSAFATMISSLAKSRSEQERLVQDAGHELRTPLTSMRTNLDILRRHPDLPADERADIVDDLHAETEELTALVNEVVAVASGGGVDDQVESFDLRDVASDVAERFSRRNERTIEVVGDPSPVVAQRAGVHRAVSCLVDNACKFDPTGGPIVIAIDGPTVTVSDRGPGIPEADLSNIFDRFHRSDAARAMPGSGLGLSIVDEVARRHSGATFARNRSDQGAEIGFSLGATGPAR